VGLSPGLVLSRKRAPARSVEVPEPGPSKLSAVRSFWLATRVLVCCMACSPPTRLSKVTELSMRRGGSSHGPAPSRGPSSYSAINNRAPSAKPPSNGRLHIFNIDKCKKCAKHPQFSTKLPPTPANWAQVILNFMNIIYWCDCYSTPQSNAQGA